MRQLVMGILAHVDAGKTTLSESILYQSGRIRTLGRVDHGDAFLDTDQMEKERGITIFSKQAILELGDVRVTLLDTPGHVDFSAEMERMLSALDYAILVISGADGVQGHTETLWKMLERYHIPAFIFVNKMDQPGTDREVLMSELTKKLSHGMVDFSDFGSADRPENSEKPSHGMADFSGFKLADLPEKLCEDIASCDEMLLEKYLMDGADAIDINKIKNLISERKLYPVYFGSALKMQGIEEFLGGIETLTECPKYPDEFGARVLKITKDEQNNRLTHLKITGGELKARDEILPGEKITGIRFYSGVKYETADHAPAGAVCAVTGIASLKAGDTLGIEPDGKDPSLSPVLDYILTSEDLDSVELYRKLLDISDEFPELHISFEKTLKEIHVHLMGEVQTEILKRIALERLGIHITFDTGRILYKETIEGRVEGVGHFEPLRHYAEVHLLMEALPRGSGLIFDADCPEDMLARNWQRLVLTHLKEKEYRGILTDSPITDMRITLIAGRAHLKHTEGGDFREATYRAVRQGLSMGVSVLLEPYYSFRLVIPGEMVGRAMTDLHQMNGQIGSPEIDGDTAVLTGRAPVAALRDYHSDVTIYTKGRGRIFLQPDGYDKCHNPEEVIADIAYDAEHDILDLAGSVFCAHGTGFIVPYTEVYNYMHVESPVEETRAISDRRDFDADAEKLLKEKPAKSDFKASGHYIGDADLEEIFVRTYGPIRNRAGESGLAAARTVSAPKKEKEYKYEPKPKMKQYLLVDGYNIIFSFEKLADLAKTNLDAARSSLIDSMVNYAGYTEKQVVVVFDAYRVAGHRVERTKFHNIYVVYTREAMTADQYIEELTHELGHKYRVEVATSDQVVQVITYGAGATILSARDMEAELARVEGEIRTEHVEKNTYPKEHLGERLTLPKLF